MHGKMRECASLVTAWWWCGMCVCVQFKVLHRIALHLMGRESYNERVRIPRRAEVLLVLTWRGAE